VPKAEVFLSFVQQFESMYAMFSVALNEAIELRRTGRLGKSCQAVGLIPALCSRLADPLTALLRALGQHAKHYGTVPNAVPLESSNFQSPKGQRTARMSDLLSRVLLTQRSQFLHKIGALEEMIGDLRQDFRLAAEDLGTGASAEPAEDWSALDAAHYDLNTCLRETIVLLKSFLVVLPEDQLGPFQKTVSDQISASRSASSASEALIPHRRMVPIEGE
jgi:hypothetical protein